jgi:hypothetical protein
MEQPSPVKPANKPRDIVAEQIAYIQNLLAAERKQKANEPNN